jgi:lipoprotein-anchoring transpeptidase ErfK/SrfK
MSVVFSRRGFLVGGALTLGGCASTGGPGPIGSFPTVGGGYDYARIYGPVNDNGYEIPGLDVAAMNPDLMRREVSFSGPYHPGTIVVSIPERRLYLVQPGGKAIRYAVGVGREQALNFQGSGTIARKAVWPHWTPTAWMMKTMPRYRAYAGGMNGGLSNPLGARALYLYRGAVDTDFRLHGTNEPDTIGTPVSSGCIRLINQDIIDLYNRVPLGTTVVVLQGGTPLFSVNETAPPPQQTAAVAPPSPYPPSPYTAPGYGYYPDNYDPDGYYYGNYDRNVY